MASALRRISHFSSVTSPGMRMARPGPGNGWRPTNASGSPSSRPSSRTSSLNNSRSGSTSFMFIRSGSPPTLWWLLIVTDGRPSGEPGAFDHVGIERALSEEIGAADLLRLRLEYVDELGADELALGFRVGDALQPTEKIPARVDVDQRDVVSVAEQAHDLIGLTEAH